MGILPLVCITWMQCLWRPEGGVRSFRTGVTDSCKLPWGAGNRAQILWEQSVLLPIASPLHTPPGLFLNKCLWFVISKHPFYRPTFPWSHSGKNKCKHPDLNKAKCEHAFLYPCSSCWCSENKKPPLGPSFILGSLGNQSCDSGEACFSVSLNPIPLESPFYSTEQ